MEKINIEVSKSQLENIVGGLSRTLSGQRDTRAELITSRDEATDLEKIKLLNHLISGTEVLINETVAQINKYRPLYMSQRQIDNFPIKGVE